MVRAVEIRDIHEVKQRRASSEVSAPDRQPATPRARDGRFDCPRCDARLLFDGEKLACLMCGYEHAAPRLRAARRSPAELLDTLPLFRSELIGQVDALGADPEPGSPGNDELRQANASEEAALRFGRLFAHQSLVSSGHSLIALARGLEPPTPEYGTWSIVRAVLDSASLVCWILDPDIARRDRARRSLAVQIADLDAECQFLACLLGQQPGQSESFADALAMSRARRQESLAAATELGGAVPVPEPSERAHQLDAGFDYLMCSSILDGRPWALLHASAVQAGCGEDPVTAILTAQVQLSATWYARAIWAYARWMSRDSLGELQSSLEFWYDSLVLPDDTEARFWRAPAPKRTALTAS